MFYWFADHSMFEFPIVAMRRFRVVAIVKREKGRIVEVSERLELREGKLAN